MQTYKISPDLFLVRQQVSKKRSKPAKPPQVHHIIVLDCSGSMYSDLPKIREQLHNKVPKILGGDDLLSIVWFSGRGEYGTLLEASPVRTLVDLQSVKAAIDRWIQPLGCTGFKEPLLEVSRLVNKHRGVTSLFFMSDGMENQWPRAEVLSAVIEAARGVSAATFVEYGYYADHQLLTTMAEKSGGTLIFSENFDRYAPVFEGSLTRALSGAPKVEIPIKASPVGDFCFAVMPGDSGGELYSFSVESGSAQVPEDLDAVWYLSSTAPAKKISDLDSQVHPYLYACLALYAQRMRSDVIYSVLRSLGDVLLATKFAGCFGKQQYNDFTDLAKIAVFEEKARFIEGCVPDCVPPEDAFTVLDLLRILTDSPDNKVLLDSDDFKYSRIGRGRSVVASDGKEPLKFVSQKVPDGYPVRSLTYNEARPNISILVKKQGVVDLKDIVSESPCAGIPKEFPTFVYRNYALVSDGVVNTPDLPMLVSEDTFKALGQAGVPLEAVRVLEDLGGSRKVVFNLRMLPVINRRMVSSVSAEDLFLKEFRLLQAQAAQKVYNTIKKERFPRESEGYKVLYGESGAKWLQENGITDYGGFSPKTVQAESKDTYPVKELLVKIKGLSTLPSLKEARTKIASGKLTVAADLLRDSIAAVDSFLVSDVYKTAANPDLVFEAWLDGQLIASREIVRNLQREIAAIKFTVIVGQVWFKEFATLDETSLTIQVDGQTLECQAVLREVEIKV